MSDASTPTRMNRVADRGGRWVDVEHGATKGAQVGRDLYDQEGNLIASLVDYVRTYCIARDVRKINGIPVERIISRNGTLVVKEIATEAIQAGNLGSVVNIAGGGITAQAGGNELALGAGFGADDLVLYYGPSAADMATLAKAGALIWFDSAGNAYFGGTLSAGAVQDEQLVPTGENLLPNATFQGNTRGLAAGPPIAAGAPLCDGWKVLVDNGVRSTVYANCDVSYTGAAIRCRCYATTPIPAGVTIVESAAPIAPIEVHAGKTYEFGFVTAGNTFNGGGSLAGLDIRQRVTVRWYDASGGSISYVEAAAALTRVATTATATLVAPAGAVRAIPAVELLVKNTNATPWDISMAGGSVLANVFFTQVWMRKRDEVRVAGSGEQIGDQRNLPQILTNNYGAVRTATALSATSAGAISVNAHTVRMGSFSVSYNAVASAITGKAAGTSWIVYCTDADYTGGTKTWSAVSAASSVANLGDGIYVAGSVTIPSSGSTSGGGGGTDTGYCVDADAWLEEGLRARDVLGRDDVVLEVLDLPNAGLRRFRQAITGAELAWAERVRLVTDEGAELELAAESPLDLVDADGAFTGERTNAAAMLGRWVVTDWGLERVAAVVPLGGGWVVRIHVAGYTYPAGSDPEHRIFTHNPLKP